MDQHVEPAPEAASVELKGVKALPPERVSVWRPVARGLAKTIGRPFEVRKFERQIQQYLEDMLGARTPSARRLRVDLILWLAQAERVRDAAQRHGVEGGTDDGQPTPTPTHGLAPAPQAL